ncbi:polymorphic toxin-type HINT domain-containing protein [Candidatus Dependentiae bacterium]
METKHFKFIFFTIVSTLLNLNTVFPSILSHNHIKTGISINDYTLIQNLKIGDEVLGCEFKILENGEGCIEFLKIPIREIKKLKINKLVFIETRVGQLCVGENKKFYNSENNNWVYAKNLTINDKLLDIDFNNIAIEKIFTETLDEEINSYELLLDEPHTFFICDSSGNPILVHNFAITIPLITFSAAEGLKIIGLSTAIVVVGKQILNGLMKHFAQKNGADVSGFNPEVSQEDLEKNDSEKDKDTDKNEEDHEKGTELDELLKGITKEPATKGRAKIFSKPGGEKQRLEDFKKINFDSVKTYPNGTTVGVLPDGRTVNTRANSSDKVGRSTTEIQNGKQIIKIRYNN